MGGLIADTSIGYRGAFCVTLGFHAASLLCLVPLVWLVPRAERRRHKQQPLASTDVMRAAVSASSARSPESP